MTAYYFVAPTDTLFVRGNLAFGDAGEHGASVMPPPPSLFAGAFRSALLGRDAERMRAFLDHGRCDDARLHACLGTSDAPGAFRVSWLSLALFPSPAGGEGAGGEGMEGVPEAVLPLPADLLRLESGFAPLHPRPAGELVASAGELPLRATLMAAKQEKPQSGRYLRQTGFTRHLHGQALDAGHEIEANHLYRRDPRLGIGLNAESRSVQEGLIYTTEGFAFLQDAGFLVGIEGMDGLLPEAGQLRLGGDGRGARYQKVHFQPPQVASVPGPDGRFRLLLQTPALFAHGWLPDGISRQGDDYCLAGPGFSARLVCAAMGRREIVSGWDLYHWKPKPAQAAVPAGSVYWFDRFEGDPGKLAEWVRGGLWGDNADRQRRAEGYNNAWLAAWPQGDQP
jgi:CRISPR-associated protein Cmr3